MKHNDIPELLRHIEELAHTDSEAFESIIMMTKRHSPAFYHGLLGYGEAIRKDAILEVPLLRDITCAQLTLFDNWKKLEGAKPVKPSRSREGREKGARAIRFKAQLELWTITANEKAESSTRSIKVTFNLMDNATRVAKMTDYTNPTKSSGGFVMIKGEFQSPEWETYATSLFTVPDYLLCGPGFTNAFGGTSFICNTMAMINAQDADGRPDNLSMIVTLPHGGHIDFHSFTDTYAGRAPLSGAAVRVSRLARSTHHSAWRTGVLPTPMRSDAIEVSPVDTPITKDDIPY